MFRIGDVLAYLACLWGVCFSTGSAWGQDRIHTLRGNSAGDQFGIGITSFDGNGDGVPDVLVGAFQDDPAGMESGSVTLFDGRDGSMLYEVPGRAAGEWFGRSVARLGDLNGDGTADYAVGAATASGGGQRRGRVTVHSGADGSVIHELEGQANNVELGWRVAAVGDLNGDQVPDFAASAHNHISQSRPDSVWVFSGADASVLLTIRGDHSGHTLGVALAGTLDVNGDGVRDLIIGAAFDDTAATDAGSAGVYSGKDGSKIWHWMGASAGDRFGIQVAAVGDTNGDDVPDILIGANGADGGGIDSGAATLYSGRDGSTLLHIDGASARDALGNLAAAGDQNRDGFADFLVGSPSDGGGSAQLFSGFSGDVLYEFEASRASDSLGRFLESAEDMNGDGIAELLIASPSAGPGVVSVRAGNDLYLQAANREPAVGQTLRLDVRGGAPDQQVLLYVTAVDEVPMVQWFQADLINSRGNRRFATTVPAAAAGHSFEFQAFAVGNQGKATDSAQETVRIPE